MRAVVFRFFTFTTVNDHPAVYWGLAAIWLILIVAAFLSLQSQPITVGAKMAWFAAILFLPIVGIATYACWCLVTADWAFLKPIFSKPASIGRYTKNK